MKKACYILLIAATSIGIAPSANAAQFPIAADLTADLPLIPLERSLIPCDQTAKLGADMSPEMGAAKIIDAAEPLNAAHALANALVRGLLVANRTGEISYAASLSYRVQNVVRGLRRGEPLAFASTRAKVPMPVVDHLLQLGNYDEFQVN